VSNFGGLPVITDQSLREILAAERAVLVLTKTGCGYCAGYEDDIRNLLSRGQLQGAVVGKMILDQPGSSQFKRDNPWLRNLEFLPYTLLYRKGIKVDEFAASKGPYLLERFEAALLAIPG